MCNNDEIPSLVDPPEQFEKPSDIFKEGTKIRICLKCWIRLNRPVQDGEVVVFNGDYTQYSIINRKGKMSSE